MAPMGAAMWNAEMTFPIILRRSIMIAISSHVEHVLRRWCELLHGEWSLPRKLGKPSNGQSDLQNCMIYLKDVAGLSLGDFEKWPEWLHVDGYRVARNCLAHNGGIVERQGDRAKIALLAHVEVDESGLLLEHPVVHLLPGACDAALDVVKTFFDRLAHACQQDPRASRP